MSTETNTSKSIMFTFYDEISFIVLISFIDYSSGEGILEHSIQKGKFSASNHLYNKTYGY